MMLICPVCGDETDDSHIVDENDLHNAIAQVRYGNLDEALVYLARAIPALDGLPPLVAKVFVRREAGRAEA